MPFAPNDKIRFATIGTGGMGMGDIRSSLSVDGTEFVAACDLYDGRLTRIRELYGNQVAVTKDHREIIGRKDIDAVIIATPDHWHAAITKEALAAGKHVYCQKPMVHSVSEGLGVIAAEKASGKVLQIGSQYVSSLVYQKARNLYRSGVIGELNMVEAYLDRSTAIGAWQYSIPPDASPATVDWDRFLGSAPKRPFEPIRFFRWRNYKDYGTAVAGDLFVHLLSGLHLVTGSMGPVRMHSMGGLRHWKDGRETPDVMMALLDYPKTNAHPDFTLVLRVNFASGGAIENFGFRFVGSEGVMATDFDSVKVSRRPRGPEFDYTIDAHRKSTRDDYMAKHRAAQPERPGADSLLADKEETYSFRGHNAHKTHHENFYASIRNGKPSIEDGTFGFRAAAPALLANTAYYEDRMCRWDPVAMKTA